MSYESVPSRARAWAVQPFSCIQTARDTSLSKSPGT